VSGERSGKIGTMKRDTRRKFGIDIFTIANAKVPAVMAR